VSREWKCSATARRETQQAPRRLCGFIPL
jgi:hypothetical protein